MVLSLCFYYSSKKKACTAVFSDQRTSIKLGKEMLLFCEDITQVTVGFKINDKSVQCVQSLFVSVSK